MALDRYFNLSLDRVALRPGEGPAAARIKLKLSSDRGAFDLVVTPAPPPGAVLPFFSELADLMQRERPGLRADADREPASAAQSVQWSGSTLTPADELVIAFARERGDMSLGACELNKEKLGEYVFGLMPGARAKLDRLLASAESAEAAEEVKH